MFLQVSVCPGRGGLCPGSGGSLSGSSQQAGVTHPTGMLSCSLNDGVQKLWGNVLAMLR